MRSFLAALPEEERWPSTWPTSGVSYREVAALLRQPEGTVKSRIRRGLNTLRSQDCWVEAAGCRAGAWTFPTMPHSRS
ncbi:MAG: sigma factor-like helix-turn-helix DNA-binding protein [Acidimicrobiales bacterium]